MDSSVFTKEITSVPLIKWVIANHPEPCPSDKPCINEVGIYLAETGEFDGKLFILAHIHGGVPFGFGIEEDMAVRAAFAILHPFIDMGRSNIDAAYAALFAEVFKNMPPEATESR